MNKIRCAFQNMKGKTLPADICVLDHFGQLSPAAVHTADCRFDSRVKWWICFIHCHIFMQKLFFVALKQLQTAPWIIDALFFDQVSKHGSHFEHSFLITNVHAKWGIHCLLISSTLLSHATSIYDRSKWVWSFLVFSETITEFGQPDHSATFMSDRV